MNARPPRSDSLGAEEKRRLLEDILHRRVQASATPCPLSHNQSALWFLYQLAPKASAYNLSFSTRIRSAVDPSALHRACQGLVDRHAVLRTTFAAIAGQPMQLVHQTMPVDFRQAQAVGWSEEELRARVESDFKSPFDLENSPPLSAFFYSLSETNHVFLLKVHHIAFDGWSAAVVARELLSHYATEARGLPGEVRPPRRQYTDFVRWQQQLLEGESGERSWSFWRSRLAGNLPVLDLPGDRPRPPVLTFNGATHRFTLEADRVARLRELARGNGATLFMALLAGYMLLLHRWSGQEEILIGAPVSCRGRAEFEGTVGDLVNMIPLRGNLDPQQSFLTLLAQLRQTVLEALSHREFPYAVLIERLAPPRDTSRMPLFDVAFSYQMPGRFSELTNLLVAGRGGTRIQFGGLILEPYPLNQQEGQFDLNLEVREESDSILCALIYKPELFDAETIVRMAEHFTVLLDGILADPTRRLADFPMLTPAETHRLLVEWNDTRRPYDLEVGLAKRFEAQVERTPHAVAVEFEGREMTYAELNARANQLAHLLRGRGIGPEVPVGIFMERSLEMLIGIYAVVKAGGAYVPFDPDYPPERIAFMADDARAPILLTQAHLRAALPPIPAEVLDVDADGAGLEGLPRSNPATVVSADHLAYIIFTSGSTGKPKGVMNTHRGIVNRLLWMQEEYRLSPADRVLQKTPFSFDVSVWEFFWPLQVGARLVMARPGGHRDSAYLVRTIAGRRITTLHFVPSMLQLFLEEDGLEACRDLRQVFCSGEALSAELQNRFFEKFACALHNLYGPTEAAVDVTYWPCAAGGDRPVVPIGRPVANTQIYILDAQGQPTPVGVPGELHIGGVQVARGYLNRPELTAEKFIPDRFSRTPGARLYKTGDLCRFLKDGSIEYLGRLDFQVKIRGLRVELGEVENRLAAFDGVGNCVAVLRTDRPEDQRLVAYYELAARREISAAQLRKHMLDALPDYMVPQHFVRLDALPLMPNGKVDRKALPAPRFDGEDRGAYVAPRSETERRVAAVWEAVLGRGPVGIRESFFELGGHSLLLPRVLRRLRQELHAELSLVNLFQYPSVAALAEYIDAIHHPEITPEKTRDRAARQIASLKRQKRLPAAPRKAND
jgi:amino acid adenylation domain-containing protein